MCHLSEKTLFANDGLIVPCLLTFRAIRISMEHRVSWSVLASRIILKIEIIKNLIN